MSATVASLGTLVVTVAGLLVIVGARKLGWRVLAVGVVLIVAASWLGRDRAIQDQGRADVSAR